MNELQDTPDGAWTSQCRSLNWDGAKAACEGAGGRLCTVAEIKAGCSTNTGCGLNGKNVWTSDTTEVKINFGQPGQSQEGFTQLGVGDGSSGSFSGTFDFEGRTCTIAVGGYSHTRSNYAAVSGGDYTNLSTLLKSSFLCNQRCTISVNIGNLKPSHLYQMTTYHHSTSYPRGGAHFKLKYNGNSESSLQQSANGVAPNPPLIHVEQVTSTDSGEISFTMKNQGSVSGHVDLNALEIKDL
jgi:hypothetical protein